MLDVGRNTDVESCVEWEVLGRGKNDVFLIGSLRFSFHYGGCQLFDLLGSPVSACFKDDISLPFGFFVSSKEE